MPLEFITRGTQCNVLLKGEFLRSNTIFSNKAKDVETIAL